MKKLLFSEFPGIKGNCEQNSKSRVQMLRNAVPLAGQELEMASTKREEFEAKNGGCRGFLLPPLSPWG